MIAARTVIQASTSTRQASSRTRTSRRVLASRRGAVVSGHALSRSTGGESNLLADDLARDEQEMILADIQVLAGHDAFQVILDFRQRDRFEIVLHCPLRLNCTFIFSF